MLYQIHMTLPYVKTQTTLWGGGGWLLAAWRNLQGGGARQEEGQTGSWGNKRGWRKEMGGSDAGSSRAGVGVRERKVPALRWI